MPNKIILSTEKLNDQNMIVMTDGIDLTEYLENPILLYMHKRGEIIGKLTNLAIEVNESTGDKILVGYVEFANTALGREKQSLFNSGMLTHFSIGFELVEFYKTNGMTIVLKCKLRETSAVDIPANTDCKKVVLAKGDFITLSYNPQTEYLSHSSLIGTDMKKIFIALGLPDNATEEQALQALDSFLQAKTQVVTLQTQLKDFDTLKAQLAEKDKELQNSKAEQLVELALTNQKITALEKDNFVKLAKADYDTTKALLDARPVYQTISSQLAVLQGGGANATTGKTWDDYHKKDPKALEKLKKDNPNEYKRLFDEKFATA
jgi:HK97 family phage prohead protease